MKAVLFDAVGTLIEPDPPVAEVYHRVGTAHGAVLPQDEVGHRFRTAFRQAFADSRQAPTSHAAERAKWRHVVSSVFQNTPAPIDAIFADLWSHFGRSENWSLFPEVADVWRSLESHGYVLGVASNYDDRLPAVLAGLPPLDGCRHVFWSSRVGYAKPHPQFFAHVAAALELAPDQILLVGDDLENDVWGAQAAGWKTMLLDRKDRLTGAPRITTLADLLSPRP